MLCWCRKVPFIFPHAKFHAWARARAYVKPLSAHVAVTQAVESSKVDETQGFLTLGHSNWTICRLLNWFCPQHFHLFAFHTGRSNFLLPQRKEGRKEQGLKMGKRKSPKSEWNTGVSDLWAFKMDHLRPVKLILFYQISTFLHCLPK